jgi:hypothetical protein
MLRRRWWFIRNKRQQNTVSTGIFNSDSVGVFNVDTVGITGV